MVSYFRHMIKLNPMTGEQFKDFYTGLGYSQQSLAKELDYDPRQLRRWEKNEREIPRYILLAIEGLKRHHKKLNKN